MPLVSIIVPVYNAEKYIECTVANVKAQTFTDWELILVDDCSRDTSAKIIDELADADERIIAVHQSENMGAAAARNRGLSEAKGRYIAFLDADDVWHDNRLERTLEFSRQKDAGFVFSAYEFGDEEAKPTGKIVHVPEKLSYKKALSRTVIFTTTTLFDTQKIDRELLSMPLVKSEDTATWWKILRNGHEAYGLDEVLAIYRRPANSLSSNKVEAVKRIWHLYRDCEKMNVFASFGHMIGWAVRATLRRI